jgi:pimeloyl-ACP methyl ester carboxylesterase
MFVWFGMGSFAVNVAVIASVILLFNLLLRSLGGIIDQRFKIKAGLKRICKGLLIAFNIIVPLCGITYAVQDGMLFYHFTDEESREFLSGREGYSEVRFTALNGKTYHGMMYQNSGEKAPLVIYFGGNAEVSYRNLRNREEQGQWQYFPGYHYLFMDYEGYGLNDGRTHYLNMYEQALAVYDYAASLPSVDSDRIAAMGYSIGTGSAVYLAANRPVSGLILAAPYASGYDLYNNMLPVFRGPMRLLVKQKLPSETYAPDITCPVLIIASRADETIPLTSSERLADLMGGEVSFMTLENVFHNNIFQAEGVFDRVKSFLEEVAAK